MDLARGVSWWVVVALGCGVVALTGCEKDPTLPPVEQSATNTPSAAGAAAAGTALEEEGEEPPVDEEEGPADDEEGAEPTAAGGAPGEAATDGDDEEPPAIIVRDVGFSTPESVLHDPVTDLYLVSNIVGSPLEKDGKGFISRVKPDGTVAALKFIDADAEGVILNAPKGMALVGRTLWVADIDVVRTFDADTGAPGLTVDAPGATFLNDVVAAPGGGVYVTDSGLKAGAAGFEASGTDAVYKVSDAGELSTVAKGDALVRPNGVVVVDEGLLVVSFGDGGLYRLSAAGERSGTEALPGASLDGIVAMGDGRYLVSSWATKAVYVGRLGGPWKVVLAEVSAPADIGWDAKRGRLLVPRFEDHMIELHPVPAAP